MLPHDPSPTIPQSNLPPGREPPGGGGGGDRDGYGEQSGDQIGPYRLLKVLGEGGFGVVWLAERREPMVQRVALKVVKPGMDTRDVVARFEQERQALAVMDHPNIAKVFDGGVTPAGRPYFVMEYVAGEAITTYTDRNSLDIRARLELFAHVCDAVQHAHMKGIIHRDIKPSNILVSVNDGQPSAKVIDFGVAKAVSHTLTDKTIFTQTGQLVGTPEYMSPEQAEMGALDIDTRTDVYSLGVVLYELLTGGVPFESKMLRSKGYAEIQRIIRDTEPPKPSTRLTSMGGSATDVARHRQLKVDELTRQLQSELEWIPLRAMQKDRTRRYQTARELGEDIGRYLRGEALVAGPESAAYRLRKFMRRNKGPVTAAGAVAVALVLGLVVTLWMAKRIADERDEAERQKVIAEGERTRAEKERDRAETIDLFVQSTFASSSSEFGGGQEITVVQAMQRAIADIEAGTFAGQPGTAATLRNTIGRVLVGSGAAQVAEPLFRQALDEMRTVHKGDHADVALSLNNLAEATAALGRVTEAELLFTQSLEMRQRLFPGDHRDVAQGLSNLASAKQSLGRSHEAEVLHQQALEMRERLFKGDHADIAISLSNMAALRLAQGKAKEAEPLIQRALDMRQRLANGHDDPVVAKSLSTLGNVKQALGQSDEALSLLRRALEINERLYKSDHPEVARNLSNMAFVLQSLGRMDEGLEALTRAVGIRERVLPGDHPDKAVGLFNLARLLQDMGRLEEAEQAYDKSLKMRRSLFPSDHPDVAIGLAGLAGVKLDRGHADEAAATAREAVDMLARLYPDGHPRRALAMSTLALVLNAQGKTAEAKAMIEQAVEMVLKSQPPTGPHAKRVLEARKQITGE